MKGSQFEYFKVYKRHSFDRKSIKKEYVVMRNITDGELFCSAQSALLGHVTPNLRAVFIKFEGNTIILTFFYDKKPSGNEVGLAILTHAEVNADFPSPEFQTTYQIIVHPYPLRIIKDKWRVYARYEGQPF